MGRHGPLKKYGFRCDKVELPRSKWSLVVSGRDDSSPIFLVEKLGNTLCFDSESLGNRASYSNP